MPLRELEMSAKDLALALHGRPGPSGGAVQTTLAHGNGFARPKKPVELLEGRRVPARVELWEELRMNPKGDADAWTPHRPQAAPALGPHGGSDDGLDSSTTRPLQDLAPVDVELWRIEVAVSVNHPPTARWG